MTSAKHFRIIGTFSRKGDVHKFTKELRAISEERALDKVYSLIGSSHKVKRGQIKIDSIEAIKAEEAQKPEVVGEVIAVGETKEGKPAVLKEVVAVEETPKGEIVETETVEEVEAGKGEILVEEKVDVEDKKGDVEEVIVKEVIEDTSAETKGGSSKSTPPSPQAEKDKGLLKKLEEKVAEEAEKVEEKLHLKKEEEKETND